MSASIRYPGGKTASMWNDSFRIIHRFLESHASTEDIVQRVIQQNPLAIELKFLNLDSLQRGELESFIRLLSVLQAEAPIQAAGWSNPKYIEHFIADLAAATENGNKTLEENPW